MNTKKKRILIDLDGVLNTYNGNFEECVIPPIKKGAKTFLKELYKNYELYIYTTRNLLLTAKWLIENNIDKYFKEITSVKIPAFLFLDDRALNFKGDYKTTLKEIYLFKTYWN